MKNGDAKQKSVLITGATDGLGKALALLLAKRGYRVFAAGRSPQKLAELDAAARGKKLPLESIVLDVCSDDSVQRAVNNVLAKAAAIDVLVNNAGVNYTAAVEDLTMNDWRAQFETNFFGVLRVTRAVLPHMRERRCGRILMMSSLSGLVTPPTQGAYSSSKHALEGLSNALRMELYAFGIDVVLIEPGYIITGLQKAAAELSRPYVEKGGPYASLYAQFFTSVNDIRAKSKTTPEDCARVMLHAIETPQPKPRYGVTSLAPIVKWSKRLLTDSAVDAMLRRRYGVVREQQTRSRLLTG
jgi:NAD(P)-dependent dehydrogenase (short-subunit alcohol dehydrogenase family)